MGFARIYRPCENLQALRLEESRKLPRPRFGIELPCHVIVHLADVSAQERMHLAGKIILYLLSDDETCKFPVRIGKCRIRVCQRRQCACG